ncbi:thioredoxin-like domain-containing protein [Roridomyces roridus]|uniref:protein disulfide-isomerase n=1 Tax=Roridomyces roridus TaxID=1738132 RepID=A0AAD7FLQ4_9AGAR|nr:thioredoxin-like domain-containing protein [Roridomyces roridus]
MRRLCPSFLASLSLLALPFLVNASRLTKVSLAAFYDGLASADARVDFLAQIDEATVQLATHDIHVTKVDCATETTLCELHKPGPLPFLRVYHYGIPNAYHGKSMEATDIVAYLLRRYTDTITEVNVNNFEVFKQTDTFAVLAFVREPTDAPAAALKSAARKFHQQILFGMSTDPETAANAQVSIPSIVVYRTFDDPRTTVYPGNISELSAATLEAWLTDLSLPLIGEFSEASIREYIDYFDAVQWTKPMATIILDPTEPSAGPLIASLRPLAAKYRSEMVFSWMDLRMINPNTVPAYGFAEINQPSFVIQSMKMYPQPRRQYPYDQKVELDPEGVEAFVELYLKGGVMPAPLTRPIPVEQPWNVYELVRAEWDEVVLDDTKYVFIEFYGDHERDESQLFMPTWYQLGERFAGLKDKITIAHMDADGNDVPLSVGPLPRYPALTFKPAGTREFIRYEGELEIDELVAFVEEHAGNSLLGQGGDGVQDLEGVGSGEQVPIIGGLDSEMDVALG